MLSKEQAEAAANALMKPAVDDRAAWQAARVRRAPAVRNSDVLFALASALLGFVATVPFGVSLYVAVASSLALGVLVGVYLARRHRARGPDA